jgi:very-short-patch-repair endonuclease
VGEEVPFEAVNQAGVFTRKQAYADGWTARQVRRRLDAGRWKVVAGAGLAAVDTSLGPRQLAYATLLTWPGAVVSHQVAGALHGLPVDPRGIGTATVRPDQALRARSLRAHRLPLRSDETAYVGGILVTSETRTAVDLLALLTWDEARGLWAWLVTRRRFSIDRLESAIESRSRRVGTAQLRRIAASSTTGSLSVAEDRFHALLATAGLTGWAANVPVTLDGRVVAVVDVLFAAARVAIEIDGFRVHGTKDAFQSDRTKQNRLIAAGYLVLRFTWQDLEQRPQVVVRTVKAALMQRGPEPPR